LPALILQRIRKHQKQAPQQYCRDKKRRTRSKRTTEQEAKQEEEQEQSENNPKYGLFVALPISFHDAQ
jgi:hypothetical protein